MFTGLIETTGRVAAMEPMGSGVRLTLTADWPISPAVGDSICVSGCCLTLAEPAAADGGSIRLGFDVVPESLQRTTLGGLRPGSRVNLEASCTPSTLLGGHIVQGHVEGVGEMVRVQRGDDWRVTVRPPAELMPCIAPKGSVTLEGISLTIAAVDIAERTFEVAVIPTTLAKTTLGEATAGQPCNIETDIIARTVVHHARYYAAATDTGA
ncbi:MAG: riboflavin synthase [Planctomycetota bacterium]